MPTDFSSARKLHLVAYKTIKSCFIHSNVTLSKFLKISESALSSVKHVWQCHLPPSCLIIIELNTRHGLKMVQCKGVFSGWWSCERPWSQKRQNILEELSGIGAHLWVHWLAMWMHQHTSFLGWATITRAPNPESASDLTEPAETRAKISLSLL